VGQFVVRAGAGVLWGTSAFSVQCPLAETGRAIAQERQREPGGSRAPGRLEDSQGLGGGADGDGRGWWRQDGRAYAVQPRDGKTMYQAFEEQQQKALKS
jgi:hypothetical protein